MQTIFWTLPMRGPGSAIAGDGIGLGTSYPTWRIKNWKTESVMVHNAPLHVWLKYGLAGLACYLWFHVALLGWLYRQSKSRTSNAFLSAVFAYLAHNLP